MRQRIRRTQSSRFFRPVLQHLETREAASDTVSVLLGQIAAPGVLNFDVAPPPPALRCS